MVTAHPQFHDLVPHLLRPPGDGIPVFSAGVGAALALQRRIYSASGDAAGADAATIHGLWRASLAPGRLARARVALIGVPSDTGAGLRRGAAYGPRAIRDALCDMPRFPALLRDGLLCDLGDVLINPHLLHDDMLSAEQRRLCQEAMYPAAPLGLRSDLAVSPLSQLAQVLRALWAAYPHLRVFVLGGDHSVAWPVCEALAERFPGTLGIVQPDAHTDLLPSRLGVKYCFGSWSFHASALVGPGRLVQVGIRQSGRDRGHWESTTGVRQFWAAEIRSGLARDSIREIIAHLQARGVRQVYFSNDIDGTDESEASATGAPVADGLSSAYVLELIAALAAAFPLPAADVMEVAPDLAVDAQGRAATTSLAARYALACIEGQLLGQGGADEDAVAQVDAPLLE